MILVTGGAGFIGSNLIHALNREGYSDIVIDDVLITAKTNKTVNLSGARFLNVISPWDLSKWLADNKPELIVHLGAITDTTRHDGQVFADNFVLSVQIFQWCTKHRVPLIYASSAATYGNGHFGFSENVGLDWLEPISTYAWSKHCFDMWVMNQGRSKLDHPPSCVGLKFFNVYGPRERHKGKMASIITQKYNDVLHEQPIQLFNCSAARDFIFVGDVCDVIIWFMNQSKEFDIYNVGTGTAISFESVIITMAKVLNKPSHIEYIDIPESIRPNYQIYTCADMTKLHKTGFDKPFTSLEDGIKATVQVDDARASAA